MASTTSKHRWTFYSAGGVEQVQLATGADIMALPELDPKLWVALSCPVKGLELDERTLALLDADGDGRVRVPELVAAIEWLRPRIGNPDELLAGKDGVPLASIAAATAEGKALLSAARHVLKSLDKPTATAITVADAAQSAVVFKTARFNGDGVLPAASTEDPELEQVVADAIACLGGTPDRSEASGVSQAQLDAFFAELEAHAAWHQKGEDAGDVLVLGAETAAAAKAVDEVRAKVDDYFARCRLVAYDPRAKDALDRDAGAYAPLAAQSLSRAADEAAELPLARVEPGRALPLGDGINPAWQARIERLRDAAARPLLGQADLRELSDAAWGQLDARLAPFRAWQAEKAGAAVEGLGIARVRALLAGDARARLGELIAADLAAEEELGAITDVERLARYYRDFYRLLQNFVAFADFYARRPATFQAGTLYLDGRSCDLCLRVADAGKHGTLAGLAKTYLVYCDCTRKGVSEKLTIAAAITAGDADHLMVGRNGLFFDRAGQDWDATVTKVVEHPISVRQAFWLPYKRLARWIEDLAAKRAAAADEAAAAKLQGAATGAADAAKSGKAPAEKPKFDVGVVAALGVAVGGITAALGALLDAFFGLGAWMPVGLLALVLLISGPSMAIAWMKLRQRSLGPLLDANGWAVNGRVSINLPLGASLTTTAKLPKGAIRKRRDPFAPRRSPWPTLLVVTALVAAVAYGLYRTGHLGRLFPEVEWLTPPPEAPASPAPPPAEPPK